MLQIYVFIYSILLRLTLQGGPKWLTKYKGHLWKLSKERAVHKLSGRGFHRVGATTKKALFLANTFHVCVKGRNVLGTFSNRAFSVKSKTGEIDRLSNILTPSCVGLLSSN